MDLTEAKDIKKKWQEYTESEQSESHSVVSGSLRPHGLYSPWNSPGQYTGVVIVFLLQGFFPTEGSNPSPTLHVDSFPEELGKKDLQDPCNHDGVITHLEPDILECEVKWALGSITTNKVSGGDGIPVELFQNLKDDAVKVLHSICQQIGKTQQWPQDWERSVFIPIPREGNAKECSNYHTIVLISHTSQVMLKILQARLQQCMNYKLPGV